MESPQSVRGWRIDRCDETRYQVAVLKGGSDERLDRISGISTMDSSEHVIFEILIAIGAAIVGVVAAIPVTLWVERRKQRANRTMAAFDACLELQEILGRWMDEISDVTEQETSVEAVRKRLQTVYDRQKFERQVKSRFYDLKDEPLCAGLLKQTNVFTRQAFESKGRIAMALVAGRFTRDYKEHRHEALQSLRAVYKDFDNELQRVVPLLKSKAQL
jgi:hypothetical protein